MKLIYTLFLLFTLVTVFTSCDTNSSSAEVSNEQTMEANIRHYFSMGDTVDLAISVVDTIFSDELFAMQENVNKNYNLAQMDIDTLDYAIEVWENKMFAIQDKGGSIADINAAKVMLQMYQLNQVDTKVKQLNYKNSNRIFTHLQLETQGKISGYEAAVSYKIKEESNTMTILLDATLKVVD